MHEKATVDSDMNPRSLSLAPTWTQNGNSKACPLCFESFTMFRRRRHHCRQCGSLACGKCSEGRALLPHIDPKCPVRVCDRCLPGVKDQVVEQRDTSDTNTSLDAVP